MRIASVVVLVAFLNGLFGCTSITRISAGEIKSNQKGKIVKVVLKSGETITYGENGGKLDPDMSVVRGYVYNNSPKGELIEVKYEDIQEIHYKKIKTLETILVVTLAVEIAVLMGIYFFAKHGPTTTSH